MVSVKTYRIRCQVPALKDPNIKYGPPANPDIHINPILTFAIQMRLNMTSLIPVDKPLPVPGHVPVFLRIMTSPFGGQGEKWYNRHRCGLRCTRILSGVSSSPKEALSEGAIILRSWAGGRAVLHPGRNNPENILLPVHDPAGKNPARPELMRPGKFFAGDFWSGQNFTARPLLPGKFRCDSRLGPGKFYGC